MESANLYPFNMYPFIKSPPDNILKPRLRIKITDPNTQHEKEAFAFIDSGSDMCCLPRSFAKLLKIGWWRMRKGKKRKVYDATGKKRRGYEHSLIIQVYGINLSSPPDNVQFTEEPEISLGEVPVVFTRRLKEPLLGIRNFLDRYVYTVNHAKQKYSIHTPHRDRKCNICKPGT